MLKFIGNNKQDTQKYDDDEISLWFLEKLDWCIDRENNTWLIRISHDYLRDIGDYALTKIYGYCIIKVTI